MVPSDGAVPEDDALLARYAGGDLEAARMLMDRHAGRCLSLARRMLRDETEAEDIAQEAMLRLWKIAPDWRSGEAKVSTWLYRVTSNLCTDRLRRARRQMVDLDQTAEPADDGPSVQARMEAGERVAALHQAIAALPERQRLAVQLRHLDEMSNIEIAEIMGTSVEAVESLLARARRALAAALAGRKAEIGFG
ncbi:MAG: RNA polymerase sigma factor [Alphaproteobacteria bacterium]|nr:MAG: RNA polymerase sigma factor [Alphaproteobacteria bacterium]